MQNYKNLKHFILLFGLLLPIAWCGATTLILKDGYSAIQVKVAQVQSVLLHPGLHQRPSPHGGLPRESRSSDCGNHNLNGFSSGFHYDNPGLYFKIHAAHVTYANVIWLVHPHHND